MVVLGGVGVVERLGDQPVQVGHDLPRLHGDGLRYGCRRRARAFEELHGGKVLRQVFQREAEERFLLAEGVALAVVHPQLGEVAGDDVAGLLGEGKPLSVGERLLGGRDLAALAHLGLRQVDAERLLLDDDLCGGDEHVDVAAVGAGGRRDGRLEFQQRDGIFYAEHALQEIHPEQLRVLVLVALAAPAPRERLRVCFLARHARPFPCACWCPMSVYAPIVDEGRGRCGEVAIACVVGR